MKRGVEAVFQLLIGVITAILIVSVAYRVLESVQANRCKEEWQNSAFQLADALADAARSSGASNFVQLMGTCGGADRVVYQLRTYNKDPHLCNRICHKPVSVCYAVSYIPYTTYKGKTVQMGGGLYCADISPYTYFQLQASVSEACASSSGPKYRNITNSLLSATGFEVNRHVVNAYVRSVGYGDKKRIYICAEGSS